MHLSHAQHRLNQITGAVVGWLDAAHVEGACQAVTAWIAVDWQLACQVLMSQGVAPYLHAALPQTVLYAALPTSFCAWLADQHERNAQRIQVFHAELAAILQQANRVGLRVMPLKGSLLTTHYYSSPALRPMADIDLLIAPADLPAMTRLLEGVGYRYLKLPDEYKSEYKFIHPTANRIVDAHNEHPDNPRPVEVHTSLRSGVWGGAGIYDVTAAVWSTAREVNILGEPAWAPAPAQLLTSLVTHAFRHFFRNEGRMIHWLDLSYVAPGVSTVPIEQANWSYPVYCMAQRALPSRLAGFDLSPLAAATHTRIRRWSEQVALDVDCGLTIATVAPEYRNLTLTGRLGTAWNQWRPNGWRLALAYGDTPVVLAYGRYTASLLGSLWARIVARKP